MSKRPCDAADEPAAKHAATDGADALRRSLGLHVRGERCPPPVRALAELALPDELSAALRRRGFVVPTPIQAQAWPAALAGHDVVGIAPTGSGKTLAFLVPALAHILSSPVAEAEGPSTVVLAPTRELARQIADEASALDSSVHTVCIQGGMSRTDQVRALRLGADVVVATPGRLTDLLAHARLRLHASCRLLVLDEADRLLSLGLEAQVREVVRATSSATRQTSLWSATLSAEVAFLARELVRPSAVRIEAGTAAHAGGAGGAGEAGAAPMEGGGAAEGARLASARDERVAGQPPLPPDEPPPAPPSPRPPAALPCSGARAPIPRSIAQRVVPVPWDPAHEGALERGGTLDSAPGGSWGAQLRALVSLLEGEVLDDGGEQPPQQPQQPPAAQRAQPARTGRALIFASSRRRVDELTSALRRDGWPALCIHGDKAQLEREWVLAEFREGRAPLLVATDVAQRGLDIPEVGAVVNFDAPPSLDAYVHRVGRTGRAGAAGAAYTLMLDPSASAEQQRANGAALGAHGARQGAGAGGAAAVGTPFARELAALLAQCGEPVPEWLTHHPAPRHGLLGGHSR